MPASIRDVAKLAGTSATAVSATLNGSTGGTIRVGVGTRERIHAAAAQLNYSAKPFPRFPATAPSKVLGLMLPYPGAFIDQDPFCSQVVAGMMREVVRQQYNLMLYTATGGVRRDGAAEFVDSRIEGLVSVMPQEDSPVLQKCRRRRIPFVSILQPPADDLWTVNSDDYAGGRLAAEHLISLGHRRIAHLLGSPNVPTTHQRMAGFRDGLRDAGIELDDSLLVPACFSIKGGQEAARSLLSRGSRRMPTAIFAANDLSADGAMRVLREAGLSVPADVAVVGYDDTWFAATTRPPLTSIHMPIFEMGEVAVKILIARMEGRAGLDTQPMLPVSLTVRRSCGADYASVVDATTPAASYA